MHTRSLSLYTAHYLYPLIISIHVGCSHILAILAIMLQLTWEFTYLFQILIFFPLDIYSEVGSHQFCGIMHSVWDNIYQVFLNAISALMIKTCISWMTPHPALISGKLFVSIIFLIYTHLNTWHNARSIFFTYNSQQVGWAVTFGEPCCNRSQPMTHDFYHVNMSCECSATGHHAAHFTVIHLSPIYIVPCGFLKVMIADWRCVRYGLDVLQSS